MARRRRSIGLRRKLTRVGNREVHCRRKRKRNGLSDIVRKEIMFGKVRQKTEVDKILLRSGQSTHWYIKRETRITNKERRNTK